MSARFMRLSQPEAVDKPGFVLVGYWGFQDGTWVPVLEQADPEARGVNTPEGWNALSARMEGLRAR